MVELHAAYVVRKNEGFIFLSPDGEDYLEVNLSQLPEVDEAQVQQMREQTINLLDGKTVEGEPRDFRPLRYARRWFTGIIPHEEDTSDVMLFEWSGEEWITDRSVKFQGELQT